MAYGQPIESMAYNRWIYGHNDLKERNKTFAQEHISITTRPYTCFLLSCTNMATMTLGETIRS